MPSPLASSLARPPVRALLVRVGLTAGMFGLGVAGFGQVRSGHGIAALEATAWDTFEILFGHFPAELQGKPLPWTLMVARWGLPVMASWATLNLLWLRLRDPLRAAWIGWRGDHLVLGGDGDLAARVAQAERAKGRPVLLWTTDPDAPWAKAAADRGAARVAGGPEGEAPRALALGKARRVLLVGSDGAAAAAQATVVLRAAEARRTSGAPLQVLARVDDPDLRRPLEARLSQRRSSVARARFISVPEITARQLFLSAPLDAFQRGSEPGRRLLVLGFGPMAESYVLRCLALHHHRGGGALEVTALDRNAARRSEVFAARRPGVAALARVAFEEAPVDEPSLLGAALARAVEAHGAPGAVVVDTGDAERDLAVAVAADGAFARLGVAPPPIHAAFVRVNEGVGVSVRSVVGAHGLAAPELLLQDELDTLARAIHEAYLEGRLSEGAQLGATASLAEWEDLPEEVRDDNRLLADTYTLKLRDIGARLVEGRGEGFAFAADELETLSRAEHDRWTASKLLSGWTHGDVRDEAARRHPDIVPYDALSEAVKELDREQVRMLTAVVARVGRRPVRDLRLGWDVGRAIPGAWTRIVAAVAERYPDRAAVLVAPFEDGGARTMAREAQEAGAPVQLVVGAAPDAVIDRLAGAERDAARRLYLQADRVFAHAAAGGAGAGGAFPPGQVHVRLSGGAAGRDPGVLALSPGGAAAWGS